MSEVPYGKIIKEIRIEGLKRTKEYIVTRELISKIGEPLLKENIGPGFAPLTATPLLGQVLPGSSSK